MADHTLTTWFPASIKPVHLGVYMARMWDRTGRTARMVEGYAHWNGEHWGLMMPDAEGAYHWRCRLNDIKQDAIQHKQWRGLSERARATEGASND